MKFQAIGIVALLAAPLMLASGVAQAQSHRAPFCGGRVTATEFSQSAQQSGTTTTVTYQMSVYISAAGLISFRTTFTPPNGGITSLQHGNVSTLTGGQTIRIRLAQETLTGGATQGSLVWTDVARQTTVTCLDKPSNHVTH